MATRSRKKEQTRLLNEIRDQLILQAKRWGREGYYTPVRLDEMTLEQCRKVQGDLLSEAANLGYELFLLESNKRDLLIKMERLEAYLKKAEKVIKKYERGIRQQVERLVTDRDKLDLIRRRMQPQSNISILLNSN
jgi:hypothetical protein